MQEQRLTYLDRSYYAGGPWDNESDRIYWIDEETKYPCLMKRNMAGVWCGYVAVDESHPFYGKDYHYMWDSSENEVEEALNDIEVHGGLTYAGPCDGDAEKGICHIKQDGDREVWWFGFDCNHGIDYAPVLDRFNVGDHKYRDEAYVMNEVKKLALQLKANSSAVRAADS